MSKDTSLAKTFPAIKKETSVKVDEKGRIILTVFRNWYFESPHRKFFSTRQYIDGKCVYFYVRSERTANGYTRTLHKGEAVGTTHSNPKKKFKKLYRGNKIIRYY